jgi:hypothetical protein
VTGPEWRFGNAGPRRMDQRTKAGLGVQAQRGRGATRAMPARRRALDAQGPKNRSD